LLRPVATRHRERLDPVRHRVAHELLQVLAGRKLARPDPSRPRLGGKREALGLSAARTRVVEEHPSLGARRERKGNTHAKRAVRRGEREQQADGGEYRENVVTADQSHTDAPASATATTSPRTPTTPRCERPKSMAN
jgi:hypothetical protein